MVSPAFLLFFSLELLYSVSFVSSFMKPTRNSQHFVRVKMVDSTLISLGAGSVAGMVGIGTAYPLDTLKTKAQTYVSRAKGSKTDSTQPPSMVQMVGIIIKEEGIQGLFNGVYGVVLGEALVKAILFGSNFFALTYLTSISHTEISSASFLNLCLAAAFSGFTSSFVLNPIDRIKILMQADESKLYNSEFDCIQKVLTTDGLSGLLLRGLDGMFIREIPGCIVYFVAYSLLVHSILATYLGLSAPFFCGGAAGVLAWIPIYPSDVIKTTMQNTQGPTSTTNSGSNQSTGYMATAISLFQAHGLGVFFNGIQPKLLRAAVNHSVTFFVYDLIMRNIAPAFVT